MKVNLEAMPTFQLLVPRQTNNHDCGLYTLCYIEALLKNHQIMELNMSDIANRSQLRLFPRSQIFAMRELLRLLFKNLLTSEDKAGAIAAYVTARE
jgi:Ulp1 family protease